MATYGSAAEFQSLIEIQGSTAPTRYEFPINVPAGAALKVEVDGSVSIRDAAGVDLGGLAEPWAFDNKGAAAPTRFEVSGGKLTQVVSHGTGTAYPVIADPSGFWGWAACVGTVMTVFAANATILAKIAKVVKRFGSLKGAELLGVYEIRDKSFK